VMNFMFLKEKKFISITLGEKILPIWQLKTGLLDLRQDISAQKRKTIQEGHLWSPCLKMSMLCTTWSYRLENFSQKDISGTCRVHHPWCVGHDEMGAKEVRMQIRSMITRRLHRQFLGTSDGTQQTSWLNLW
jgi:hypothetical protein